MGIINVNQCCSKEVILKTTKTIVNHIPITKARVNLGAVVKRAHLKGEYFILEKDGIPVAGIMSADELEDYLELRDPGVIKQIEESKEDQAAGRVRDAREFLEELKRERAARQKRITKPAATT
jgi:PHD/YefM family antitoxin component YafN of YafNO toxin-antitoxin module